MPSLFVSVFFTVTEAFATTSSFGLVTRPPIAPVTVDCPKASALIPRIRERTKESFTNLKDLCDRLGTGCDLENREQIEIRQNKKEKRVNPS